MAVGLGFFLLFFFVGETFWDRTPRAKYITKPLRPDFHMHMPQLLRSHSRFSATLGKLSGPANDASQQPESPAANKKPRNANVHVAFEETVRLPDSNDTSIQTSEDTKVTTGTEEAELSAWKSPQDWGVQNDLKWENPNPVPDLRNLNSPWYTAKATDTDYFSMGSPVETPPAASRQPDAEKGTAKPTPQLNLAIPSPPTPALRLPAKRQKSADKYVTSNPEPSQSSISEPLSTPEEKPSDQQSETPLRSPVLPPTDDNLNPYTDFYRAAPPKTYWQGLRPYSGRLCHDKWLRVATRPFILFAYPAILWSAVVYSLSIGWLIVLSESISTIYKSSDTYNFTSLQAGLVYLSPFIGGILGTAAAGKLSDVIVRFMARRNDGVYEPEFRLVMAIPVAIATTLGLMGFGWSAQERDNFMVPTFFFAVISFGCSLGSTTSITFAVDSYRQYAGEALVTLNFSKSKSLLLMELRTPLKY
jgi:hypothetical protein